MQAGEHVMHVPVSFAKYCKALHDASVCCATHVPAAHDDLVLASHASLAWPLYLGSMVPTRACELMNVLFRTTPSVDRTYNFQELNSPAHCVSLLIKHANLSHLLPLQWKVFLSPVTSRHCDVSLWTISKGGGPEEKISVGRTQTTDTDGSAGQRDRESPSDTRRAL